MKPWQLAVAATVLLAIILTGTTHAHALIWTCWQSNTTSWTIDQPDADYASGKYPTWADCEAWRNGDPGPGYVWSYGPTQTTSTTSSTSTSTTSTTAPPTTTTEPEPASTTTSEPAPTSTTTIPAPAPQTLPEPNNQATTTTQTTHTTTTTSVPVTTTTSHTPNITTSSTTSTSLPTASSTTDLPTTTTSPDSSLPALDSIPPTVNQIRLGAAHGVKPRIGFGAGTTPATPIVTTVTVLLTSPISPIQIARRRKK